MSTQTAAAEQEQNDADAQPAHLNINSKAWGEIPESLVRDPSVGPAELVLTAYRATYTRVWTLRERVLLATQLVRGNGLGKNVIRRTIAAMKARGTIVREAPRRGAPVEERLALDARASGYLRVWRWWFSATLTLKAMAAWLFMQAGTGKGPTVWAREIRARFGWDPKTCGKVVGELDAAGLLGTIVDRNKGGAYRGIGYQSKVWEKPGNQKPGMGKTGQHTKDSPLTNDFPHESSTSLDGVTSERLARRVEVAEESALRADLSHGKLADADCRMFLQALATADSARSLAPKLRRNARGLGRFLEAMAKETGTTAEQVVEIIEARLLDTRVRGKPVESEAEMNVFASPEMYVAGPGWIKTWDYLTDHVAEEIERRRWHERATDAADA